MNHIDNGEIHIHIDELRQLSFFIQKNLIEINSPRCSSFEILQLSMKHQKLLFLLAASTAGVFVFCVWLVGATIATENH